MLNNKLLKYFETTKDLLEHEGVIELFRIVEELNNKIEDLNEKIFNFELKNNNNKENDLIDFLKDLFYSCNIKRLEDYSKKEILDNLKEYIREFSKNNKINL